MIGESGSREATALFLIINALTACLLQKNKA